MWSSLKNGELQHRVLLENWPEFEKRDFKMEDITHAHVFTPWVWLSVSKPDRRRGTEALRGDHRTLCRKQHQKGKTAERTRCRDRSPSLIRGRLVQEIRPLGKALCLACLRLPVIIIKNDSPMATAEQSSHFERSPMRMKTQKLDRTGLVNNHMHCYRHYNLSISMCSYLLSTF